MFLEKCTLCWLILDARVPIFKMFHPSSNTTRTHAHSSISMLKCMLNFCSRDFLFNKKFDDSTLVKRHIVGHFVRSDTGHVMQAIDVTRHSRITQQLVPSTALLSFFYCSRFACKKWLLMTFGTTLVFLLFFIDMKLLALTDFLVSLSKFSKYFFCPFSYNFQLLSCFLILLGCTLHGS